jgi:hypothetical protein
MNTDRCIGTLELGEIEHWADSDPRRTHLRQCARCQAELASYREFVQPPDEPSQALPESAARALRAAFAAELRRTRDRSLRRPVVLRWPLLAASAVAAALLIGILGPWNEPESLGPLRAGEPGTARARLELGVVVRSADGGIALRWSPVEGADSYRIRLFDAELNEIGAAVLTSDTSLQLPAESIVARAWQVDAVRAGVSIAASELVAID